MGQEGIEKNYEDFRLYQHLIPMELPNKKNYLNDLYNISDSFVGRIDTFFLNYFVFECEILLINSIALFEKGYFDNACYSLRQALEVANNMAYFSALSDEERALKYKEWGINEKLESRIVGNYLNSYAENYKEIKVVFKHHFDTIKQIKEELNTIVHKLGLNTFYSFLRANRNKKAVDIERFTYYLETLIGTVAILRLTIDPIPVLLMDEEMNYRLPDLLTEPYDTNFIMKYIGEKYIEDYKNTQLYKAFYDSLIKNEKYNEATANLVKCQYIDVENLDDILSQAHLLSFIDLVALSVAISSSKISRIHYGGLPWYFTNTKSLRNNQIYDSRVIQSFASDKNCFNQAYDNVFMSFITNNKYSDFMLYIEHNSELTNEEIQLIENQYIELMEKVDL